MKAQTLTQTLIAAAAAAALLGLAGAASAATPDKPARSCFFSRDWGGWHAPDQNTLYLRVGMKDIYRIDLSSGSPLLTWPNAHIVSKVRGSDSICSPIDLDLSVSTGDGVRDFLIAKTITHLTPEQVAAIPKKDLP